MTMYRTRAAQVDADQITADNVADLAAKFDGGHVAPDGGGLMVPRYPGGDDMTIPLGYWVWSNEYGIMISGPDEFAVQYEEVPDGPRLRTVVEQMQTQMEANAKDMVALRVDLGAARQASADAATSAANASTVATAANRAVASLTTTLRALGIRV